MTTPVPSNSNSPLDRTSLRSIRLSPTHLRSVVLQEFSNLPEVLREQLEHLPSSAWADQNPRAACAFLRSIRNHPNLRTLLREHAAHREGLLPVMAIESRDPRFLQALVDATPRPEQRSQLLTIALKRAVQRGKDAAVARVLELGADADGIYDVESGSTLLHEAFSRGYSRTADLLMRYGADAQLTDKRGLSPLGGAIADKGFVHGLKMLRSVFSRHIVDGDERELRQALALAPQLDTALGTLDRRDPERSKENRAELARFVDGTQMLRKMSTVLTYFAFVEELRQPHREPKNHALIKLLPDLLFAHGPRAIEMRLMEIDERYDHQEVPEQYLTYEGELALLMNHPSSGGDRESLQNSLVYALTAVQRYVHRGQPELSVQSQRVWAEAACLGFSFGFWRLDAMRCIDGSKPSRALLEEYGLTFERERATDQRAGSSVERGFGAGFVLWPGARPSFRRVVTSQTAGSGVDDGALVLEYDNSSYIEFRHAYLLASHPQHGTLIVRNGNSNIGRPVLRHFAYWSPQGVHRGFTTGELLGLTAETVVERFQPITAMAINEKSSQAMVRAQGLLSQIQAIRHDYRAWKYDTNRHTAYQRAVDGEGLLMGGHYSPGFSEFVSRVNRYVAHRAATGRIPALAFASPFLPPWRFYQFETPTGQHLDRLALTTDVLGALHSLTTGHVDRPLMHRSGLGNFLNQAGLATEGELIVTDMEG